MNVIYILSIVADLGLMYPKASMPFAAYSTYEFCESARERYTKLEDKSYLSYKCQEIEVRR